MQMNALRIYNKKITKVSKILLKKEKIIKRYNSVVETFDLFFSLCNGKKIVNF